MRVPACSGPSESSSATAAVTMGWVDTPVAWIGNRPGTGVPSVVMPLNGVATAASALSR